MSMSEIEAQVLDTIDRWVEKEVKPIARKFDQADEYPHDLVEQMGLRAEFHSIFLFQALKRRAALQKLLWV